MTTKTGDFTVTQNPLTSPWENGMAAGCRAAGAGAYATAAVTHASIWLASDYTCTADQSAEITLGSLSVYDFPGVVLRWAATGGGVGYRIFYENNAGTLEVHRWSAGASAATIASFAQSFANGDTLKAQIIGTTLKVYKNGAQIGADYTDANVASGQFGITYTFAGTAGTRITAFTGIDGLSAGPTITSVSTGTPREGASLTITGTGFGASQGAGNSTINGIGQTETSWANTQIVATVVLGTNKFGAAYNVAMTDNAGTPSNNYAGITGLLPVSGNDYVNVGTPYADPTLRLTSIADAVSGDQVEWETQGGLVVINSDLTWSAGPGVIRIRARIWTSGSGYGPWTYQILSGVTATTMHRFRRLANR